MNLDINDHSGKTAAVRKSQKRLKQAFTENSHRHEKPGRKPGAVWLDDTMDFAFLALKDGTGLDAGTPALWPCRMWRKSHSFRPLLCPVPNLDQPLSQ